MLLGKFCKQKIKVGDPSPDFTLLSQSRAMVSLHDFLGKKCVILYFYPKDDTYNCIAESCDFRDSYHVFLDADAEVIGVSSDTPESHSRFAAKYKLPFTLLSDEKNEVRKLYHVPKTMGVIPGRVTYVIDKKGIVRHIFSSQFNPKSHVEEALKILRDIIPSPTPQHTPPHT
jgi:peroxiredoxin Q/BCP